MIVSRNLPNAVLDTIDFGKTVRVKELYFIAAVGAATTCSVSWDGLTAVFPNFPATPAWQQQGFFMSAPSAGMMRIVLNEECRRITFNASAAGSRVFILFDFVK